MIEQLQVYKCQGCGIVAEILDGGQGHLACCGQPMLCLDVKTAEEGREKHVPVVEKIEGGFRVKVGDVPHPMLEKHYIQWVELLADGKAYRQFLKPGQAPEAVFHLDAEGVTAREMCNIHGMWKG
ncbi:MAG: desulfoferrodoxin [Phycisphaerae bacterium SM23_33]|jgi:superoxide reductase|nr:MAG: desulfoferrodoxin [Phycisphaerae bacterium SM23_33]